MQRNSTQIANPYEKQTQRAREKVQLIEMHWFITVQMQPAPQLIKCLLKVQHCIGLQMNIMSMFAKWILKTLKTYISDAICLHITVINLSMHWNRAN